MSEAIQISNSYREIVIRAIPTSNGHEYQLQAVEVQTGLDGKPETMPPLPSGHAMAHICDFVSRLAVGAAQLQEQERRSGILVP